MCESFPVEYYPRDALQLDQASEGRYSAHVQAMTQQQLVVKADIAAELAYRDHIIKLQEALLHEFTIDVEAALGDHVPKDSELYIDLASNIKNAMKLVTEYPDFREETL